LGRGFFAGISWGALVGVVTLALASQLADRRELAPSQPQRAEVEIPGGSAFNQARPETDPILPQPDVPPAAAEPVAVAVPEPVVARPSPPETAPASAPETAEAPEPAIAPEAPETAEVTGPALEAPAASEAGPSVAVAPEPDAAADLPPLPSSVPAPVDVAQPTAPEPVASAPAPAIADSSRPSESVPRPAPEAPSASPAALAAAVTPPIAPEIEDTRIALTEPSDDMPGTPSTVPPRAPQADALPGAGPEVPTAPEVEPDVAQAPAAPETPTEAALAPRDTGIPTPGFSGAAGVRVNRLPTIGDGSPAPEAVEVEAEVPAQPVAATALVRNAIPFQNPGLAPVVAIVLLHDAPILPADGTGRDLAVPVSFAVDAGLLEAGEIADAYRAAGREIVLVPTLPPGAAPADVEVALQVNFDVIPEAVALMDLPDGGFQAERQAVAQVVAAISATGHGLVTFPRGLNMAQQLADRAGVPARPVFRMLEAGDTDAALRTLDQAAFRARQEGTIILVGQAEPATVEAIRRWAEANRAGDVLFAPISAALSAGE
jgi:uncharacterized protein